MQICHSQCTVPDVFSIDFFLVEDHKSSLYVAYGDAFLCCPQFLFDYMEAYKYKHYACY